MLNSSKKLESIAILNSYKDEISKELYEQIVWVIGNLAIEDMFLSKEDIKALIRQGRGEVTANELIGEFKQKWGVA